MPSSPVKLRSNQLMNEHPGEIKAQIVEENGQVVMRKTCPKHGEFCGRDGH